MAHVPARRAARVRGRDGLSARAADSRRAAGRGRETTTAATRTRRSSARRSPASRPSATAGPSTRSASCSSPTSCRASRSCSRALTEPDAGVVVNPPVYGPFFATIRGAGRRVVEAPLALADDGVWQLDLDALERAFADGAAVYLLCNPHNPTGRVYRREELTAVARARRPVRRDRALGRDPRADGARRARRTCRTSRSGEEAAAHGLTLASASKAWNIAGLKAAVVVSGSEAGAELAGKLPAAPAATTRATSACSRRSRRSTDGGAWLDALLRHLDLNRRRLASLLERELPAVALRDARGGLPRLARLPRARPRRRSRRGVPRARPGGAQPRALVRRPAARASRGSTSARRARCSRRPSRRMASTAG